VNLSISTCSPKSLNTSRPKRSHCLSTCAEPSCLQSGRG
jgi:hypothetical protein